MNPDATATREAGQQLAEAARTMRKGDTVRALHWVWFRWRSAPDPYEREVQAAATRVLLDVLKAEQ
jgi:hypothetical protein